MTLPIPEFAKWTLHEGKSAILLGQIPYASLVVIRGRNPDVDIATVPEDLIPQGGVYAFQTAAQSLEVLSASAADTAAGTGARTVLVNGLDINYLEISETIALNGVTAVPLVLTGWFRVNVFTVTTAGSGQVNAGTITLRVAAAGASLSVIEIGFGIAHSGVYTVPADHTVVIISMLTSSTDGSGAARLQVQVRESAANNVFVARLLIGMWGFQTLPAEFGIGFVLTEKSDLRFRVISSPADNTQLSMTMSGILYRTANFDL